MQLFIDFLMVTVLIVFGCLLLWMGIRGAFSFAITIGRALEPHPAHSDLFDRLQKTTNITSVALATGIALLAWAIVMPIFLLAY